jgi:hypothetical protein
MSKKRFSIRTLHIIESRWSRGISAVSIAGELGTHVEKVQAVIDSLEKVRSSELPATAKK